MAAPLKIEVSQTRSGTQVQAVNGEAVETAFSFRLISLSDEDNDGVQLGQLEITSSNSTHIVWKESDRIDALLAQYEELGILT